MAPSVLVTGASGFVGRYIMRGLGQLPGIRLTGVVHRSSSGTSPAWEHVAADLAESSAIALLAGLSPSVIVHAAAVLPKSLDDDGAAVMNARIDGHVVDLARASGSHVIFISSTSVYANSKLPWTETSQIARLPAYAAAKYATEQQLQQLGADAAILRISSPYGASDPARKGVLYEFVRQAVAGQELRVFGAGDRTQDFIHAQDVGNAVRLAVLRVLSHEAQRLSGPLNIVSGSPISMLALAKKIVGICGAGQIVIDDVGEAAAPYRAELSRDRARAELAWEPHVPIDLGIAQLVRRFRGGDEDWLVV